MFSPLEESEDFFEVQIIERINDDYDKFHKHDFFMFLKTLFIIKKIKKR